MRRLIYIITILILAAAMTDCNTSGCLENRSSIPLAKFYSSSTGQQITISKLTITGVGMPDSQPLSDGSEEISQIYLPMRSTMSTTAWRLSYPIKYTTEEDVTVEYVVNDTISFDYEAYPYFASDECGVVYNYNIKHMYYTHNLIDSVALTDSLINNLDVERIQIYFRTDQSN